MIIPALTPGIFLPQPVASTTTWDPASVSSLVLSNGNLTATASGGSGSDFYLVRTIAHHTTGKFYCEQILNTAAAGASVGLGFGNGNVLALDGTSGTSPGGGIIGGSNNISIGVSYGDNRVWFESGNAASLSGGLSPGGTNVLQIAVDLGALLIWFAISGGSWNSGGSANPATGVGGIDISAIPSTGGYFPYANALGNSSDVVTGNFGGSAYSFTPPSGFGNW